MTTRETWLDLAARCEAAKGPDREIDGALREAAGFPVKPWGYTESLDAITALIGRELPGGSWFVGSGRTRPDEPLGGARIFADEAGDKCIGEAECATPALALCAAFCRAMAAKGGEA